MQSADHLCSSIRYVLCLLFGLTLGIGVTGQAGANDLQGSEWRPVEIGGTAIEQNNTLFVQFREGGKLAGHGGCNRMFGSFALSGAAITIGPVMTTRMACEPAVMELETSFIDTLQAGARFRRDGTRLTVFDKMDNVVARLIQTDWD